LGKETGKGTISALMKLSEFNDQRNNHEEVLVKLHQRGFPTMFEWGLGRILYIVG
jgi:hypothetical protein